MKPFLITMFVIQCLSSIIAMSRLTGDHPREERPRTLGFDVLALLINAAFAFWVGYLMWGMS